MDAIPSQSGQMARVAEEYCQLIDDFEPSSLDREWWTQLERLLPRLHVAVIALVNPRGGYSDYSLPDDEQRFELYMRLHDRLHSNPFLWTSLGEYQLLSRLCDRLADDLTDIYFDLQRGLTLFTGHSPSAERAAGVWQSSFYLHWGQHLLDAERWLHAVDTAGRAPESQPWQRMVI